MFKFFKSSTHAEATDSRMGPPSVSHSLPQSLPSQFQHSRSNTSSSDLQRELIRVVLKDTLRRHGIPFDWLSCEVIIVPQTAESAEQLHIQLMLMKWHELFLRYALALERQLIRGLDRFDPSVDHSRYIISWRISLDCGCPFGALPPPVVWQHDEEPQAAAQEAPSVLDRRHAPRPPNSALPRPGKRADDGDYERTELSPFR